MPIEICNAFASNCSPDWSGVGAVATAAATAAALFIPFWQRCQDRNRNREALAYSLFLKMAKINSDISKLWDHINEERLLAKSNGSAPDTWFFFRPLASERSGIKFTADELAVLFSAKDNDAFNAVLSMDEVHRSSFALMRLYREKHDALKRLLPGAIMNGAVGHTDLTREQFHRFAPYSAELDMLVAHMASSAEAHALATKDALKRLHRVVTDKLHMHIGLDLATSAPPTPVRRADSGP